ncbi:MAG: hypothetical protein K9G76_06180 [Bacteroidales bacterium]|nr:hypothetical protein [Bacteroidales bacterium]MCF8402384.1 hypothetical protein [Bacteroidales bacterium]
MKKIEKVIAKNKEAFNSEVPGPEHFDRFRAKLNSYHEKEVESWFERYGFLLKVAAVILLFITVGTFFYTGSFSGIKNLLSEQIVAAELPVELKEVMQYYNVIADKKVNEIDALAVSDDEAERIKEMAFLALTKLDDNQKDLEKEYAQNPKSERIMNAMVQNQQRRTQILDKIINTLNQVN